MKNLLELFVGIDNCRLCVCICDNNWRLTVFHHEAEKLGGLDTAFHLLVVFSEVFLNDCYDNSNSEIDN